MFSPITGFRSTPAVNPAKAQPLKFKGNAEHAQGSLRGKQVIWDGSYEAVGAQAALETIYGQGARSGPFTVTQDYLQTQTGSSSSRLLSVKTESGSEVYGIEASLFDIKTY